MSKDSNAKYIYSELTKAGLTPEAACGVLGNLEAESGLNPMNLQDSYNVSLGMTDEQYTEAVDSGTHVFYRDSAGYGLAQWTHWSRKKQMADFLFGRGYGSIGSLSGQTAFLLWELEQEYPVVWEFLKTSNSVRGCSNIVLLRYECPADTGTRVQDYRTGLGEAWYEKLVAGTQELAADDTDSTAKKESYWPPRTLDRTMKGADVSLLQAVLNCRGYGCRIDGYFGEDTERKVKLFQSDSGLTADGIAGPLTWNKLRW